MKKQFPSYRQTGVQHIEQSLSYKDKKVLSDFLKFCSITASPNKIKQIRSELLQIRDVIEKPFDTWKVREVEGFLAVLNASDRLEWTRNGLKTTLKRFLKWKFKDLELLESIKMREATNYRKLNHAEMLTTDELNRILRVTNTVRNKAIVLTLYESAARPEELRNLTWDRVEFRTDGMTNITLISSKTREARSVLVQRATEPLYQWKQETPHGNPKDLVFYGRNGKPLSKVMLSTLLKNLGTKAHLLKQVYPYLFRHTRITELLEKQVPEQQVKQFAGHKPDSRMMKVYSHLSPKQLHTVMLEKVYHVEELPKNKQLKIYEELEQLRAKVAAQEKQKQDVMLTLKFLWKMQKLNATPEELAEIKRIESLSSAEKRAELIKNMDKLGENMNHTIKKLEKQRRQT